jgi:protein-disulfide isomerase
MAKRAVIREKRRQQRTRQRLIVVIVIIVAALVVVGLLVLPNFTPVGEVVSITPQPHPDAQGMAIGDPDAPVRIDVFEDFQCPACRTFTENYEPLIVSNDVSAGRVYYVFRHWPFIGPESLQAANASMCANAQGRFWDYHDMLFQNQTGENVGAFADRRLVAFAENLGLNMSDFNACFRSNEYQAEIQSDYSEGTQLGVGGTPSVFVNGVQLSPGLIPSYDQIVEAIDSVIGVTPAAP